MSGSEIIAAARDVSPVDYPWAGHPRHFTAAAMPQGDSQFGVRGEMVMLVEDRGAAIPKTRLLARCEAEELVAALTGALRVFTLGPELSEALSGGGMSPRACTARYPFRDHRTMADVLPASSGAAAGQNSVQA